MEVLVPVRYFEYVSYITATLTLLAAQFLFGCAQRVVLNFQLRTV